MANAYPDPCDTCRDAASCKHSYGCAAWQIRYRYRQKQINAFARRLFEKKTDGKPMFAYQHPDETRHYLADGPCKGCKADPVCNVPCPAYLRWWDTRMQILRKKVGA